MEFRMEERTPTLVAGYSCHGIEFYDEASMDGGTFFYMAAARLPRIEDLPEDMVAKLLPGGSYAVFEHRGSVATLAATFGAAYSEALPAAGLEPAGRLDFERYDARFKSPADPDSIVEIWIPVRKR